MKKLISISVVLILLASAAFADVGATVIGQATLLKGENTEKTDGKNGETQLYTTKYFNGTGYNISRIRLSASGALDDGTLGGALRYDGAHWSGNPKFFGWAWWKPSDLIKLQIGSNGGDGEFGLDGIGRWGFYQLAGDAGVASEGWAFGSAFYEGWNAPGIMLNITPADGLAINIGIPINGEVAFREYKNTTIQVKYNIDGVGTVGLTYLGNQGEDEGDIKYYGGTPDTYSPEFDKDVPQWIIGKKSNEDGIPGTKIGELKANNDNPKVIAYFGLSSIENLGIDIGIGYKFSDTYTKEDKTDPDNVIKFTSTINNPLAVGLGVSFSSGSFGVKTRVLGEFLGSKVTEVTGFEKLTENDPFKVVVDVLPYFAINDTMTFYLSAGFQTITGATYVDPEKTAEANQNNTGDWKYEYATDNSALFSWHVNPYIVITPNYWTAAFFAGLRIEAANSIEEGKETGVFYNGNDGDVRNRIIKWSIPIGIIVNF